MPFELITDAEVAAALGVAVDANLTRIVKAAHAYVYRTTKWDFERKERTAYVPGYGVSYTYLTAAPIWSVAEVRIDSTGKLGADTAATDLTAFVFDNTRHDFRLHYIGGYFPEGPRVAMVRFLAGYHPTSNTGAPESEPRVPNDLREEMINECTERWRRGTTEKYKSASLGDFSYTRDEAARSPFVQAVRAYSR